MENKTKSKLMSVQSYKAIGDSAIEIVASDESVDRDGDVIIASGWDCANWLKSGSLIYGHDPSEPENVIGKAESAEVKDGKLVVSCTIAAPGTSPMHDCIRALLEQKILRGVSVGFRSNDYEPNQSGGLNYKSAELIEVSLTPVPANPNAMVLMKSFGMEKMIAKDETDKDNNNKWDPEKDEDRRKAERRGNDRRQPCSPKEEANSAEPESGDKEARFMKLYDALKSIQ